MTILKIFLLLAALFVPFFSMGEAKKWQKFICWTIFCLVSAFFGPELLDGSWPKLWVVGLAFCVSLIWSMYVSMDNAGPPKGMLTEEDTRHFSNSTQSDKAEKEEVDWNHRCSSCHLNDECRGPSNGACQRYP